jgi:hypothetical protein
MFAGDTLKNESNILSSLSSINSSSTFDTVNRDNKLGC